MGDDFKGPLFIVGLSRSGTKLIRDLLNRNERILLPGIETHFIPKMLLDKESKIEQLYAEVEDSLFVKRIPEKEWPKYETLDKISSIRSNSDLVEAFLKYYALQQGEKEWDKAVIWGDKTPSYLRHLNVLNENFPDCKIIHIVRDPRDRALSVNKTWGKSMKRATELWRREVQDSISWANKKDSYCEVKYEDLISNTRQELTDICRFLNIEYSDSMMELSKPSEKYGKNSKFLKPSKSNKNKFKSENIKKIKRLEEIAYPMMKHLGYEIQYAKKHKPVSEFNMFWIKVLDFIKFKTAVKIKGY